ncbi:HET-domain-containing protein [Lentinus brumalis]|uniref:HET-domain-containing protein n=1 Tax=Lentinus brumalis TaxID=2498619 RepID=A0A371DYD8_9APHY|nr:HET-domain-containing protein [Polyporus brumalis]
MWLLSTDRAELHYFPSPECVNDGYAILSHVWDEEGEKSFQEIRALPALVDGTGATPRHLAGAKVRNACMLAESHGHKWLWADTCCIDKTSSAELSEAINSMFRYYHLASVCYAYLRDVPSDDELDNPLSPFQRCRWHRRGWTLQELLAPRFLIFLSRDWEVLGTKADLSQQLEKVTRIPATVLRFEEKLREVSIARRMSWAANRETTRVEDEAYCLMGIFGITMPTLYGEGRHAFRRLQEAIMQQYADTTLFAWKDLRSLRSPMHSTDAVTSFLSTLSDNLEEHGDFHIHDEDSYLFAKAPYNFAGAGEVYYTPPRYSRRLGDVSECTSSTPHAPHQHELDGVPTFSMTPHGILARLLIHEESSGRYAIASMSWFNRRLQRSVGLLLIPCPHRTDPVRPLYCIFQTMRLVSPESVGRGVWQWKEVYLVHRPPPGIETEQIASIPIDLPVSTPFRFWHFHTFLRELSMNSTVVLDSVVSPAPPWTGEPPVEFLFKGLFDQAASHQHVFAIQLGRCTLTGAHWAHVQFRDSSSRATIRVIQNPSLRTPTHVCSTDHIQDWPLRTRVFTLPASQRMHARYFGFRLAFTPCPLNPAHTLVLHVFPHTDPALLFEVPEEVMREVEHIRAVCGSEDLHRCDRDLLDDIMQDLRTRLEDLNWALLKDAAS